MYSKEEFKKKSGGDTPGPPLREGATPSRTHPQHGLRPCTDGRCATDRPGKKLALLLPPHISSPRTATAFARLKKDFGHETRLPLTGPIVFKL